MESLLDCPNKEYSDWHEMVQTMNTNLNNLEVKLTSLEENISECNQDLEQKQKVFFSLIYLNIINYYFLYNKHVMQIHNIDLCRLLLLFFFFFLLIIVF